MINCNENENDNGKIDHINNMYINNIYRPLRRHRHKYRNISCLGKTMSLCNKQHLSNI